MMEVIFYIILTFVSLGNFIAFMDGLFDGDNKRKIWHYVFPFYLLAEKGVKFLSMTPDELKKIIKEKVQNGSKN